MSNALAIAAVTTTLRHLLQQRFDTEGSSNVTVTTRPLDKARDNNSNGNQVNLFLYQTQINAAWRNMDIPTQIKPGETGQLPLALNLYYLLTAYAQNDDFPEPTSHRLLGQAMSVFHDHAILSSEDIKTALSLNELLEYDLYNQVERVRVTSQPLSLDELSKLWTTFQTQYRISAAYEVAVVLIESTRPTKVPIPVLARGVGDQGVASQASLIPPYPVLTAMNFTAIEEARLKLPAYQASLLQKSAASLGDSLTLTGYNLDGSVSVLFSHPQLDVPNSIAIAPSDRTPTELKLTLPDQPAQWPAGFYTATAVVTQMGEERTSNGLSLPLAPEIEAIAFKERDPTDPNKPNNVIVTVTCTPQVFVGQRVSLVLNTQNSALATVADRELPARNHPDQTSTLDFELGDIPVGTYQVRPRLRVDGVDSLIVDYSVTPLVLPLTFIAEQELTIL
jgi:hypothetical protein